MSAVAALLILVALPASGAPAQPDPRMVQMMITRVSADLEPFDPVPDPGAQPGSLDAETRAELTAELDALAVEHDFGLAVQDLHTGAAFSHGAHTQFPTASVAKLSVLAMLVRIAEEEDRDLTDAELAQAEQMIRHSGNEVTDDLYQHIGFTDGFEEGIEAFGLQSTEPNPSGVWGSTMTTAADQLRLLRALHLDEGPLSAEGREQIRALMESVVPEQVWGVSAAAGPDDTVGLKNGWTPRDNNGGLWTVNSVGYVVGPDRAYLVAVLSDGQPDQGTGITMIEEAVLLVTGAMEQGTVPDERSPDR